MSGDDYWLSGLTNLKFVVIPPYIKELTMFLSCSSNVKIYLYSTFETLLSCDSQLFEPSADGNYTIYGPIDAAVTFYCESSNEPAGFKYIGGYNDGIYGDGEEHYYTPYNFELNCDYEEDFVPLKNAQ